MTLATDDIGQKRVAMEIYDRFNAAKIYGAQPESLESITRIYIRELGKYPAEKVLSAISLHCSREPEFPTLAHIEGLIKRKGKPPLSQAMYVQIGKKHGEDRTGEDWEYLRDFEAYQRQGFNVTEDDKKLQDFIDENNRLRQHNGEMVKFIDGLEDRLRIAESKAQPLPDPSVISKETRIMNTLRQMVAQNFSDTDLIAFVKSVITPSGGVA